VIFEDGILVTPSDISAQLNHTAHHSILCDLSHLALLEILGDDALSFLQGQVTNDVKLLDGRHAHLSAYCTAKGRMLALFLAFSHKNQLHLQLPKELATAISKRLSMYVLRSKVQIKDVSENIVQFGINGPQAASLLASVLGTDMPTEDYSLLPLDNATILKLPSMAGHARYMLFCDPDNGQKLWAQLMADCKPVEKSCWDWLDIQAGIPEITTATQEQLVPQMLNLDLLNGINFKKGCYTGQEIVARTHYLGTVKRRTFLANVQSQNSPKAGDKLLDGAQNEIGMVVRVAPAQQTGYDMLAELRMDAQQSGQVFWESLKLEFKPLPYALEAAA
jgi:tRNA-modifying protein YgfZ